MKFWPALIALAFAASSVSFAHDWMRRHSAIAPPPPPHVSVQARGEHPELVERGEGR